MSLTPEGLEKSLQELENGNLGEIGYPSNLVITCHRLYATPLKDFNPGDLRTMIGQNFGLKYLIPLALDLLEINPWIDATFFEGDLLQYVLKRSDFWKDNPNLKLRMDQIVAKASDVYLASDHSDGDQYDRRVLMAIDHWSKSASATNKHASLYADELDKEPQLARPEEFIRYLAIFQRTFIAMEDYANAGDMQGIILCGYLANALHNMPDGLWGSFDDGSCSPRRIQEEIAGLPARIRSVGAPDRLLADCNRIVSNGSEELELGLQNSLDDFNLPPLPILRRYLSILHGASRGMQFMRQYRPHEPTPWEELDNMWPESLSRATSYCASKASALHPLPSGLVQWNQFNETEFLNRATTIAGTLRRNHDRDHLIRFLNSPKTA